MKFSGWNQYWKHKETVSISPELAYKKLLNHYKQSSKSFTLFKENFPKNFSFSRGNVIVSAFLLGSELWAKHYVDIDIEEIENGKAHIFWNINLKLFGVQTGKNAVIEECKKIVKEIV